MTAKRLKSDWEPSGPDAAYAYVEPEGAEP